MYLVSGMHVLHNFDPKKVTVFQRYEHFNKLLEVDQNPLHSAHVKTTLNFFSWTYVVKINLLSIIW